MVVVTPETQEESKLDCTKTKARGAPGQMGYRPGQLLIHRQMLQHQVELHEYNQQVIRHSNDLARAVAFSGGGKLCDMIHQAQERLSTEINT
jgi:hypothetical protein